MTINQECLEADKLCGLEKAVIDMKVENDSRKITCDQIAWVQQAIDEYARSLLMNHRTKDSDWRPILDLGLITRIMSVLNLRYIDASAAWNAVAHVKGMSVIWQEWKDKE